MHASDDVSFAAVFSKLRGIFPLRGDHAEIRQIAESYFRVLMRFPLKAVEAGADAWIEKGERFPKPAEWLASIPRGPKLADVLPMTEDDAREHQRAADLHYEDEPCPCHLCQKAGVSHRMLRYVPECDRDGRDMRMRIGDRVVVRGHWAHGDELKRWYAARDSFLALKERVWPRLVKTMPKAPGRSLGWADDWKPRQRGE
jgi:hypothetical protein